MLDNDRAVIVGANILIDGVAVIVHVSVAQAVLVLLVRERRGRSTLINTAIEVSPLHFSYNH